MDGPLGEASRATDGLLRQLARADRALDRRRRHRRRAVEATVLASVASWAASCLRLPKAGAITILFLVSGLVACWLAVAERRARRHRDTVAARLPVELRP